MTTSDHSVTLTFHGRLAEALRRLEVYFGVSAEILLGEHLIDLALGDNEAIDYQERQAILERYHRGDMGSEAAMEALHLRDILTLHYVMELYAPALAPALDSPLIARLRRPLPSPRGEG